MKPKQKELPKENLTPEGKIWMVLKTINETISISPKGEEFSIDTKKLENYLIASDCEKIFERLEKDCNAIKIIKKPSAFDLDIDNAGAYIIKVPNRDNFNKALNDAHIKHFGSIEILTGDNFLSVVDVSADIMNQLQMTIGSKVSISVIPSIIRFTSLLPVKNLINRYWDFRWKALQYLKDNGAIESFELLRDEINHYDSLAEINLDRIEFSKFYERLMKVYDRRVKFPDEETKQKTAATIPEPPIQKIEIVGGSIKTEIIGLEKGLEAIATKNEDTTIRKNKKIIRLPNFSLTSYKDATIRFLDERNVLISTPKKTSTADYEGLGFSDDKGKKPNLAWGFLLAMAKNNGETEEIQSPIPDNIKQIKRQISDFLKKLFKNDTEPFYDFSETNTYKIKINLIPPQTEESGGQDKFGVKEYLNETMTSKYEFPKEEDD